MVCDSSFVNNTLEGGLGLILIIMIVAIVLGAIYSKAWSLGGDGIEFSYIAITVFNVFLATGGIITIFSPEAIEVIGDVFSFIIGMPGVMVCAN